MPSSAAAKTRPPSSGITVSKRKKKTTTTSGTSVAAKKKKKATKVNDGKKSTSSRIRRTHQTMTMPMLDLPPLEPQSLQSPQKPPKKKSSSSSKKTMPTMPMMPTMPKMQRPIQSQELRDCRRMAYTDYLASCDSDCKEDLKKHCIPAIANGNSTMEQTLTSWDIAQLWDRVNGPIAIGKEKKALKRYRGCVNNRIRDNVEFDKMYKKNCESYM
jgi:hypothetical protein